MRKWKLRVNFQKYADLSASRGERLIIMEERFKAMAMVHSEESKGPQEIDIIGYKNNEDKWCYEAITSDGILCKAIYNPFTGLYYADDIYEQIELPF